MTGYTWVMGQVDGKGEYVWVRLDGEYLKRIRDKLRPDELSPNGTLSKVERIRAE